MVKHRLTRRGLLAGTAAFSLVPAALVAGDIVELDWNDLLPEGTAKVPHALRGVVQHGDTLASQQPTSSGIREDWNGKTVQIPGFVVPIEYDGIGVTSFILVPYVGACVHVPPPPSNQLVLVSTKRPYELGGLFEAVMVTGEFGTAETSTELADIGYTLAATKVKPYS
ncbi:MAG: DUF3299 domain-containing protein [Paracoccaceae bacterium]